VKASRSTLAKTGSSKSEDARQADCVLRAASPLPVAIGTAQSVTGAVAKRWLAAREADLLAVEHCHVVFTLAAPIGRIADYNEAVIYGLLFEAAGETGLSALLAHADAP
jgi:hypothetical protein